MPSKSDKTRRRRRGEDEEDGPDTTEPRVGSGQLLLRRAFLWRALVAKFRQTAGFFGSFRDDGVCPNGGNSGGGGTSLRVCQVANVSAPDEEEEEEEEGEIDEELRRLFSMKESHLSSATRHDCDDELGIVGLLSSHLSSATRHIGVRTTRQLRVG